MKHTVLGLDVGGTAIRWALGTHDGVLVDEGVFALSMQHHLSTAYGQAQFSEAVWALAAALPHQAPPLAVLAGVTGMRGQAATVTFVRRTLSEALSTPTDGVRACNDLMLGFLDAWEPGQGHLVYAGTGSIAVHVDAAQQWHRVGGLGHLLDDAGGGYWIAKEALRAVWRREDEAPGSWVRSPMACRMFEALGGPTWQHTLDALHGAGRGALGHLSVQVAATADQDPAAMDILRAAGAELGRLAEVLVRRVGSAPVALAGGAAHLHPEVFRAFEQRVGDGVPCSLRRLEPHRCAARWAARPEFKNSPLFAAEGDVPATAL